MPVFSGAHVKQQTRQLLITFDSDNLSTWEYWKDQAQ